MPTYYLTDGLGSTSELADGAGAVTGTYAYDVFGQVRTHIGASTEWSFTGEQNDPNGLEYLRARYYDPAIGRFLTQDPWPGSILSPQSLNPYAYGDNDPVLVVDPWGLCSKWPPSKWRDCPQKAVEKADEFLSDRGEELGRRLDQLALEIDLAAAAAVDTASGAFCAAALATGVGAPACPVFYAFAVGVASPAVISSNLISLGGSAVGCYGTLRNPKEGGGSFSNVKNCAVSGTFSIGGLFVIDPNASAVLNGYIVCRDRGRCTFP